MYVRVCLSMYENIHPAYYCISLYVYVRCMLHVAREYVLSKSWACLYVWMSTGMYACMHGLVHCACALDASQHLRCYSLCVYVPMYLLQVSILWCVRVLYVQCGCACKGMQSLFGLVQHCIGRYRTALHCVVLVMSCLVLSGIALHSLYLMAMYWTALDGIVHLFCSVCVCFTAYSRLLDWPNARVYFFCMARAFIHATNYRSMDVCMLHH